MDQSTEILEDAAVYEMQYTGGNGSYAGSAHHSALGYLGEGKKPLLPPDWHKDPKNWAVIGLGTLSVILLIFMLTRK